MTFTEEQGDLFAEEIMSEKYALCHCISSDFALGAGIAKAFAVMGVKKELCEKYPKQWQGGGYCLITETNGVTVGNLVTKERYFHKPTLETLRQSLENFKEQALKMNVSKIAMPKIGCGLDRLEWADVREIIQEVFADTDFIVKVRYI
ncbi:MAG: macro domain-containing protein [Lachnospiraceae bacterium]|nr:macro domain-containing protein [Ruminococcus sp.]MCM1275029.1 macro domain-containing protein [Lachnospiraceae bacterium]